MSSLRGHEILVQYASKVSFMESFFVFFSVIHHVYLLASGQAVVTLTGVCPSPSPVYTCLHFYRA